MDTLREANYKNRLIDKKISDFLEVFGAVNISGSKWCGKTWTGLNHAHSAIYLDDDVSMNLAMISPEKVLNGDKPILLDEWSKVPTLWDRVRRECDRDGIKGKYILTCSTELPQKEQNEKIFHSGAGRFGTVEMSSMSLFESGDSDGKASIMNMKNGTQESLLCKDTSIDDLSYFVVRGGWPGNLLTERGKERYLSEQYIKQILYKDMKDERNLSEEKMRFILRSLSRNESTFASNQKILNDITVDPNSKKEREMSYRTLTSYLNVLQRLYLLDDIPSFGENVRSRSRVGKVSKRHFVDPSIPCAILNLNEERLIFDLETFGLLFESLVLHDLKIYMDYLEGKVYHFHDNATGAEADAVLEFADGEYALVEVKLGYAFAEEGKKKLLKVEKLFTKPPIFKMVVVGVSKAIIRDKDTGIYIVPITSLCP